MSIKKILRYIIMISFLIVLNIFDVHADNTNIGAMDQNNDLDYSDYDAVMYSIRDINIARISLWNVDTNTIIDRKTFSNKSFNEFKNMRILSNMTKPEYIKLNGKMTKELTDSLEYEEEYRYLSQIITIKDLPRFLLGVGYKDSEKVIDEINEYFNNEEKLNNLIKNFTYLSDEQIKKWNEQNIIMLVEPLASITIHNGDFETYKDTEQQILLSCVEMGLLAYNDDPLLKIYRFPDSNNLKTMKEYYKDLFFNAMPFSCFKNNIEKLKIIEPIDNFYKNNGWWCVNKNDYYNMIVSLGCFEVYSNSNGENTEEATKSEITKSADLIYYTNSWVITSVNVSSIRGFPYQSKTPGTAEDKSAKNNCLSGNGKAKITYSFDTDVEYYNNSNVNEIAIPENGNAVSWLKWKCPDEECYIQIEIKTNSDDAIPDVNVINIQVVDPITNKYPPNTEATDRNDYFTQPNVAYGDWNIGDNKSLEWITYDYEWHYDWHFICRNSYSSYVCLNQINENEYNKYGSSGGYSIEEEETDSGRIKLVKNYWHICNACSCNFVDVGENHKCKICNFNKEDWGWVEWKERKHEITISAKNPILKRSKNSPNSNNSDTSIKSGYGIEFSIDTDVKYKNNGIKQNVSEAKDMVVPLQFMEVFLPEYYYEEYEITAFNDLNENGYKEENIFTLPKNPYSQFEQNCHFTPIWYPDGKYVIGVKLNKCYCPGGELNICYDDIYININGNAYDDWHIAPK